MIVIRYISLETHVFVAEGLTDSSTYMGFNIFVSTIDVAFLGGFSEA